MMFVFSESCYNVCLWRELLYCLFIARAVIMSVDSEICYNVCL